MHRPLTLIPLLLLLSASLGAAGGQAVLHSDAVPLDRGRSAFRQLGPLTYLGGWALRSNDPRFGGVSSLLKDRQGFTALSDNGNILRFPFGRRGPGARVDISGLPNERANQERRDSEAMTRDPVSGKIWIALELGNKIVRYAPGFAREERAVQPAAMKGWPGNGGPESLARLADGRFLTLSEEPAAGQGLSQGLLFPGDPIRGGEPLRFRYRPPAGYLPTDAVQLPSGRVLVLNRRFRILDGVSSVLALIDLSGLEEGALVTAREIARLRPPLTVDNMEALAIERDGAGTILWIASDDNFNPLQRTLLLKFAVPTAL